MIRDIRNKNQRDGLSSAPGCDATYLPLDLSHLLSSDPAFRAAVTGGVGDREPPVAARPANLGTDYWSTEGDEHLETETDAAAAESRAAAAPQELPEDCVMARILRSDVSAIQLRRAMMQDYGEKFTRQGYLSYMQSLQRDCGAPSDPIEAMLIEQFAMAHHGSLGYFARAGEDIGAAQRLEAADMALKLSAGCRRHAVAIYEIRARRPAGSSTATSRASAGKKTPDSEMGSNGHATTETKTPKKPKTGRRRPA